MFADLRAAILSRRATWAPQDPSQHETPTDISSECWNLCGFCACRSFWNVPSRSKCMPKHKAQTSWLWTQHVQKKSSSSVMRSHFDKAFQHMKKSLKTQSMISMTLFPLSQEFFAENTIPCLLKYRASDEELRCCWSRVDPFGSPLHGLVQFDEVDRVMSTASGHLVQEISEKCQSAQASAWCSYAQHVWLLLCSYSNIPANFQNWMEYIW